MTVEEAYANITRSGETKPVYITPQLASLLGIKAGWVLVIVGTEDIKTETVTKFSIKIIVMQF